jgi:hypothetical protein
MGNDACNGFKKLIILITTLTPQIIVGVEVKLEIYGDNKQRYFFH